MTLVCYCCGCFDHDDRDYDVWLNNEGTLTQEQRQFGPNLRVTPFYPSRRQVVSVPGFYKFRQTSSSTTASTSMAEAEKQKMQKNPMTNPSSGVGMTPYLNRCVTATLEQGCNGLNEKVMHVSMQYEVLNEGNLSDTPQAEMGESQTSANYTSPLQVTS